MALLKLTDDGRQVAAGPEDPMAPGTFQELLVVVEHVLRDPAQDLLPWDEK